MSDESFSQESEHDTQEEAEAAAKSLREDAPDYEVRVRCINFLDVKAGLTTYRWRVESRKSA